jgi:hypothetical protein
MHSPSSGLARSGALPQIAIPALSPRGTEEQGMTGDANGDQEIWPNQEIYRNSQISDYFKIPPLSDWQSGGSWVQVPSPPQIWHLTVSVGAGVVGSAAFIRSGCDATFDDAVARLAITELSQSDQRRILVDGERDGGEPKLGKHSGVARARAPGDHCPLADGRSEQPPVA